MPCQRLPKLLSTGVCHRRANTGATSCRDGAPRCSADASAPVNVLDASCPERLSAAAVVVDPHDPSIAEGENVEDLAEGLFRRADVLSACADHDALAAAGELERID